MSTCLGAGQRTRRLFDEITHEPSRLTHHRVHDLDAASMHEEGFFLLRQRAVLANHNPRNTIKEDDDLWNNMLHGLLGRCMCKIKESRQRIRTYMYVCMHACILQ
jgi:hypothetical protein